MCVSPCPACSRPPMPRWRRRRASRCATVEFTQAGTPRAVTAVDLARRWGHDGRAISSLPDALGAARLLAGREGVVLVCGSIYLVGDVLQLVVPGSGD